MEVIAQFPRWNKGLLNLSDYYSILGHMSGPRTPARDLRAAARVLYTDGRISSKII